MNPQEERIKKLECALEDMLEMHEVVSESVNWGSAFLSAETIQMMNEAPLQARELLDERDE